MAKKVDTSYPFGFGHSKTFEKSIVSDFLVSVDNSNDSIPSNERLMKFHSDLNLLLRQKSIHRRIGSDLLREYVEKLQAPDVQKTQLSDDELFQLIEPKQVNNLTTAYEYAKYIEKNSKECEKRFKEISESKKKYDKQQEDLKQLFNYKTS